MKQLIKSEHGAAVVEAAWLFPLIILVCAMLVLLSAYLPMRAAMQRSTQYAATAIATERSDEWVMFNSEELCCDFCFLSKLGTVYASLLGSDEIFKSEEEQAEEAVKAYENRNLQKPKSGSLEIEYGVVNYIIYKEITVTAERKIDIPVNLSVFGIPKDIDIVVTSTAVVTNGDEFVRNMDLARDLADKLDLDDVTSGIGKICKKFYDFLGI